MGFWPIFILGGGGDGRVPRIPPAP